MNTIKRLSYNLDKHTPAYAGEKNVFTIKSKNNMCCGDNSNSQIWLLPNHFGTHIDCPYHFCQNGKRLTDYIENDWYFNFPHLICITAKPDEIIDLKNVRDQIPVNCDILIINTNFAKFRSTELYWKNNPGFSPELGHWLRKNRPNVRIIGFDTISLTSFQKRELGREAHKAFLCPSEEHDGIRIIEDMDLKNLNKLDSNSKIIISPFFVENTDGSPVSVWLLNLSVNQN